MTLLHLSALWLFIAGNHMELVGSAMCDDGWVYHMGTATCLRAVREFRKRELEQIFRHGINPCGSTSGGQYRNISGNIVDFTETMEPFVRDYLQFIEVRAAVVEVPHCLAVPVSDSRFFGLGCLGSSEQRTYFLPGKSVPFTVRYQPDAAVVCQVPAGPVEPPVCPQEVTLVSVSDKSAVLSWRPGQLGRKVNVRVRVHACIGVPLSCEYFTFRTFTDVSLFQRMNYTVTELRPNSQYKLVVQIPQENNEYEDCNMTLPLSTTEEAPVTMSRTEQAQESSGSVVALSVLLCISLCACSVLGILLYMHSRHAKKGRHSDTETGGATVLNPKADKPGVKLQVEKSQDTSGSLYLNDTEQPHRYEKTIIPDQDEHIYET
ncbi:hypothetical protein BsWGS_03801 [Bradybaena similaris]